MRKTAAYRWIMVMFHYAQTACAMTHNHLASETYTYAYDYEGRSESSANGYYKLHISKSVTVQTGD